MPEGLVAAASRYVTRKTRKGGGGGGSGGGGAGWQGRAWELYHLVPEVRFAAQWIANAMGAARLYAGRRDDDGGIEPAPPGHRAAEIVDQIAGGADGQAQMLAAFGRHLTVPGEGWIIIRPNAEVKSPWAPEDGHDWRVLSVREVRQQSGKLVAEIDGAEVEIPEGDPDSVDPDGPVAIRVWEPDPERHIEADSPVRSSLDLLEELLLLNASVKSIARSRLTGRGVLLVPKGTRFPSNAVPGAEDDLIEVFMQVAETAIRDPESAAATVPILLEVPGDVIGQFAHLTFESTFDELALKLRHETISRFATGLEIPSEILLGLGDTNHWSAWQISAEGIRLGIEPKLSTLTQALTLQWLRPILEAEGEQDWHRWVVWYDTSPLRVPMNRSETALQVFDRGAISADSLRRETGFGDADAPTDEELAARQPPPGEGGNGGDRPQGRIGKQSQNERPDKGKDDGGKVRDEPRVKGKPNLPVDETKGPPRQSKPKEPAKRTASAVPVSEGLVAAVDGMIHGALGQAGRKLRRSSACPRSMRGQAQRMDPSTIHTWEALQVQPEWIERWNLLDGAWTRAAEIAGRYGADAECLEAAADGYTRELLAHGIEHEFAYVPAVVSGCVGEDDEL